MSWNNSVYTTLGTAMLSEALAGKGMNFTRAVSGAGTMAAAELSNATAVTDQRQTLAIASIKETGEDEDATRTIKIQITNAGLTGLCAAPDRHLCEVGWQRQRRLGGYLAG